MNVGDCVCYEFEHGWEYGIVTSLQGNSNLRCRVDWKENDRITRTGGASMMTRTRLSEWIPDLTLDWRPDYLTPEDMSYT